MEVHHPIGRGSLFAKVVFNAPLFFCPRTRCVSKRVWLEKSPEQVISDLATDEKRQQTSSGTRVGCLNVLDKEVEVLCTRWVERVGAASVRLECREVVIQEILLDLSSKLVGWFYIVREGELAEGLSSFALIT